jgi:nucleotide-binding universal stress UspA family protein
MPTYQTVVIGVHDSPTGRRAVELAAPLSSETGAKLVLVAAYRKGHRASTPPGDSYQEPGSTPAHRALAGAEKICARLGVTNVESHAVPGDPVTALADAVRAHGADLLLVGSHGLSTLSGRLLGSVPSGVSREAECDVLVVHTTTELRRTVLHPRRRASRYQRTVVVGVHDSPRSQRAAERAAQVAADFGAELVLVGAYEQLRPDEVKKAGDALGSESYLVRGSFPIEGVLRDAEAAARLRGVREVESVVVEGDAMHGLLKVADKYSADILVMGNHHLTGRVSQLLGSISEQVSRKTATHVLLVH